MKSSPEAQRVLLPSFEDMMGTVYMPLPEEPETPPEEAPQAEAQQESAGQPQADPALEALAAEQRRVEALCEGMRKEAIAQSQQIIQQAREEAVAIEDKALRHARAQAKEELDGERQKLQDAGLAAAEALQQAQTALYDLAEPYFLDTAIRIAESILQLELQRDDGAYTAIVKNVVAQTAMAHDITLHLPPARYDALVAGEGAGAFAQEMEKRNVKIQRDNALGETECSVTSNMGTVKGGVKTQLSRIRHAIAGQGAK